MNPADSTPRADDPPPPTPDELAVLESDELFHGEREIRIRHADVLYRLRITRRNKLILQK